MAAIRYLAFMNPLLVWRGLTVRSQCPAARGRRQSAATRFMNGAAARSDAAPGVDSGHRREFCHGQGQPLHSVPRKVDLRTGVVALPFDRGHLAFAELG